MFKSREIFVLSLVPSLSTHTNPRSLYPVFTLTISRKNVHRESIKSDEHPGRTTSHWIQAPTSSRCSLFFFKMCHSSLVSFVSLSIVYIGRNRTEISKNVSTFPPTIPLTSTVSLLIAVRTMVARAKKKKERKKDRDESIIEKLRGVQQNEEKRCLVILEIVSSRMGFRTFNE